MGSGRRQVGSSAVQHRPPVTPEGVRREVTALRPLPAQAASGGKWHWARGLRESRGSAPGQLPDLLGAIPPAPGAAVGLCPSWDLPFVIST